MTRPKASVSDAPTRVSSPDLEQVLDAWYVATDRLQKTHETLRAEVSRLSNELEAKNRELARKNRLADLGRMASHIAHEVRNGLSPVTLYSSLLRRRVADDPISLRTMDNIDSAVTALEATVNDLLSFTLDRDPVWKTFDIKEMTREVCESLAPQLDAQRIRTEIDIASRMTLFADRDMLRRAVLNLVLNALDVMPHGGELVITACRGPKGFELEVADSGPGIADDVRLKVFEPFYTTKSEGTGLGLAIVHRIAEAHGGDVLATNCPEGGAAFTLRIPNRLMEVAA
ncbi:MAG: PAS domain-containing sensor histidine kinase [Pirellulaceae bacterium]